MTMNRRGFIGSILALGAAPAIVRADSLMRVVSREEIVIHATDWKWSEAPIQVFTSEDLGAIIARTFRERAPQIKANVIAHNVLLARMNPPKARHGAHHVCCAAQSEVDIIPIWLKA